MGQQYATHLGTNLPPELDSEGNLGSGSWVCVGNRPSMPPTTENLPGSYPGWGGQPGSTPYPHHSQQSVATVVPATTAPPSHHSVATAVPAHLALGHAPMSDEEVEVDWMM